MNTAALQLPKPHVNQVPILESDARFKVIRAGRRFGKDRLSLHAAITGHGPKDNGAPLHRGILQGVDVLWVGPDYPQIRAIWREEIDKRFKGLPPHVVDLNSTERRVTIGDLGTLQFRSNENIDSIRGSKFGGAVINEAAFMDLEYALKEVIMPALMDLGGWVIIISSPNAGPDGHETEEGKRSPSFFNILCEKIMAGTMTPDWQHWHYTSRDNPKIPPKEVAALYAQYEPDSPQLAQELDAKLIIAGAGVAFPEFDEAVHIQNYEPPRDVGAWTGGGDWGYTKPGCLYLIWTGPERSLVRLEYYFRQTDPYTVGYNWGQMIMAFPKATWFSIDTPAVADGGPTILEELQRGLVDAVGGLRVRPPVFINPPKGPGSRYTKKMLLHDYLRFERPVDGPVPPWAMPKLQFHKSCANIIRTLPRLPRDPKGKEDVDTEAEDHAYDGIASWLMARTPAVERAKQSNRHPDDHPGFNERGARNDALKPSIMDVAGGEKTQPRFRGRWPVNR
jgi:hypothetical protein